MDFIFLNCRFTLKFILNHPHKIFIISVILFHLCLPELFIFQFAHKKSQNFEISETAKIFESQKKQVGELNYIQKNCFKQISCTDF